MSEPNTQVHFDDCFAQAISLCKQDQRPCCPHEHSHISIRLHIFDDRRLEAFLWFCLVTFSITAYAEAD
jgi:hypothetical protein